MTPHVQKRPQRKGWAEVAAFVLSAGVVCAAAIVAMAGAAVAIAWFL